ncbi:MAG: DUF2723 domain-containing protein [Candidatus Eremiobacteraeota bacterium]|nr:DUF2723 domain-containing protein [Candidatus Eremiobacteraeota bacterium]MBC5802206.1 DUF2723 domain-containing protein [Candidatus Eremiobacteraeota bacterium]MBC5821246.1 DUF2723 domain-containing protein [Candidatus Eremiobacteraeota bacterium]
MKRAPSLPWLVAALALPACLLFGTLQHDVAFWDVGELQTVPYIFGIAHPTGFPTFVMYGWLLAHAFPFGTVAARISAVAALGTIAAAAAAYRIVWVLTRYAPSAFATPLLLVSSSIVWSRGTRADVHPVALAFAAWAFASALTYRSSHRPRDLALAGLFVGLGLATHPVVVWTVPALLILLIASGGAPWRVFAITATAIIAGLSPYAYLPLRSAQITALRLDPTLRLGFGPGMPFWDYAHTANLRNFWWLVSGAQFHRAAGFATYVDVLRYPALARTFFSVVHANFGWPILLLAIAGAAAMVHRSAIPTLALAAFAVVGIPFALGYTEEADKERYLLQALWAISIFAALGLATLSELVASGHRSLRAMVIAAASIALTGFTTYAHRGIILQNRDAVARHYLDELRTLTPDGTIVVAAWTYATPVAYGTFVDGTLGNRVIVTAEPATVAGRIIGWSAVRCVVIVTDDSSQRMPRGLALRILQTRIPRLTAVRAASFGDRCRRAAVSGAMGSAESRLRARIAVP